MKSTFSYRAWLFASLFFLGHGLFGQAAAPEASAQYLNWAIHLGHAPATSPLTQAGYQDAWGFSTEFLYSRLLSGPREAGLQVGIQGAYYGAGGRKHDVLLRVPLDAPGTLRVRNYQANFHGILRLISPEAPLRVYADARLGTRMFGVEEVARITGPAPGYEEGQDGATVFSDWAFSYGTTAGAMIRLSQVVSLDLQASYLNRNEASFVNLESVAPFEQSVAYDYNEAAAGQWFVRVGLSFKLFDSGGTASSGCGCCCGESSGSSQGAVSPFTAPGGNSGRSIAPRPSGNIRH